MKRRQSMHFTCAFAIVIGLSTLFTGCGRPATDDESSLRDVFDVPNDLIQKAPARHLFFELRDIVAAQESKVGVPVADIVAMIPISASDLRRVASAFPRNASVNCSQGL